MSFWASSPSSSGEAQDEYHWVTGKDYLKTVGRIGLGCLLATIIVLGFVWVNWNYIMFCSTPETGYISMWDMPNGEYDCIICKSFLDEELGKRYIEERCTVDLREKRGKMIIDKDPWKILFG